MRQWAKTEPQAAAATIDKIRLYLKGAEKQHETNLRIDGATLLRDAIEAGLRVNSAQVLLEAWQQTDEKEKPALLDKLLGAAKAEDKQMAQAQQQCSAAGMADLLPNLVSTLADSRYEQAHCERSMTHERVLSDAVARAGSTWTASSATFSTMLRALARSRIRTACAGRLLSRNSWSGSAMRQGRRRPSDCADLEAKG